MPEKLTTESLTRTAADSLSWLEDFGFKYFKSYGHFRHVRDRDSSAYIQIDSVTHNRVFYHLAFHIGTLIRSVEEKILELGGSVRKIDHWTRTIRCYTVNIGPKCYWKYPISGSWSITSLDHFASVDPEMTEFVKQLVLPYVIQHVDPLAVRRTLIETPNHSQNINPHEQILGIDLLHLSVEQLEADIALLNRRSEKYAPGPRARFENFVGMVRKSVKGEMPSPQ